MTAVVQQPDLIPKPWATNGSKTTIPETTSEFGRASWDQGFPASTATPLSAGGIPPSYLDFQGVLYALSRHAIFEQAGGRYAWDSGINYPAGACIIGSNGVVYQALQESGPDTSAGAKNPTSSGNSAYWGPLATPDGSTIKLTNGKLAVSLGTIADGTTIITNNNKLSVSPAGIADGTTIIVDSNDKLKAVGGGGGGDADSLVDNKTTIANNGKITVDLANATALLLDGITPYLIKPDGGLLVDPTTGKIAVAFPELHIPLWIGENGIGTEFYVNGSTGVDTTTDGQGRSAAKPWATIAYATQQICSNYNINSKSVHINVAGGTYTDTISLPEQQRTTGSITIRPASDNDTVNVSVSVSGSQRIFSHVGGRWYIDDINITLTLAQQTSASATYPGVVYSSDPVGEVHLRHCPISFVDNTVTPVSGTYGSVTANLVWASGGAILIENKDVTGKRETAWSGTKGHATVVWLFADQNGRIIVRGGTSQAFNVSGSFSTFCATAMGASYRSQQTTPVWNAVGSPTGKRYDAYNGGQILTNSSNPSTFFPGNASGTVDSATYSWIN